MFETTTCIVAVHFKDPVDPFPQFVQNPNITLLIIFVPNHLDLLGKVHSQRQAMIRFTHPHTAALIVQNAKRSIVVLAVKTKQKQRFPVEAVHILMINMINSSSDVQRHLHWSHLQSQTLSYIHLVFLHERGGFNPF